MIYDPTHEAMINPRVGDRFEEFYTHWVYVVKVTRWSVWTIEASAPCIFPQDGKLIKISRKKFHEYYSYKSDTLKNKYFVNLCDRGNNVDGWI
jgi:hypothetical protein